MNTFPSLFSKFLRNSTAVALIAVSSFSAFAMDLDLSGQGPSASTKRLRLRPITPNEKVDINFHSTGVPQSIEVDTLTGKIKKVTTDFSADALYQLESNPIPVKVGERIKIPYDITVESGGIMAVGVLNTARDAWLYEEILTPGHHKSFFESVISEGEEVVSLVVRNYHIGTPGQTTFTINSIDVGKEGVKQQPTIRPPIVKITEEEKAPSAGSTVGSDVKIKLNPASGIENKVEFQNNGVIKVITDDNALASYQLESDRLSVQAGQKIKVPYNITVEPGGIMAVSLLNTNRDGWLYEQILKAGPHNDFFEVTVPEGEREVSLVFLNYHIGTPGQTTFTINSIDMGKEEVKQQPTAPSALSTSEAKVKIKLNPASEIENKVEFQNNGTIKVITDNNASASYQLESDRLFVQAGQKIKVPYNITVEPGGIMAVSLLNTNRDGWLYEQILKAGPHNDFFEVTVPEGEREISLVFLNYHLGTPGQTTFTINSVDFGIEEIKQQPTITPPIVKTIEEEKAPSALSTSEAKVKIKLNPASEIENKVEFQNNGVIKVITDNNANASYQLESDRLSVQAGQKIKVPYNITVEPGGIMAVSLLNTNRDGWLHEQILKAGPHNDFFEVTIPEREREVSLVFLNYHIGTPGQTIFTINSIDMGNEETILQPAGSPESIAEEKVKLNSTGAGQVERHNGKIKVTTDNNNWASYQLTSDRFDVVPGQKISVPYNITVEEGGILSIGLLNTNGDGWLFEQILKAGPHKDFFEVTVPEGQSEASLVFRNYHLGTPGQTIFTINSLDIGKEMAPVRGANADPAPIPQDANAGPAPVPPGPEMRRGPPPPLKKDMAPSKGTPKKDASGRWKLSKFEENPFAKQQREAVEAKNKAKQEADLAASKNARAKGTDKISDMRGSIIGEENLENDFKPADTAGTVSSGTEEEFSLFEEERQELTKQVSDIDVQIVKTVAELNEQLQKNMDVIARQLKAMQYYTEKIAPVSTLGRKGTAVGGKAAEITARNKRIDDKIKEINDVQWPQGKGIGPINKFLEEADKAFKQNQSEHNRLAAMNQMLEEERNGLVNYQKKFEWIMGNVNNLEELPDSQLRATKIGIFDYGMAIADQNMERINKILPFLTLEAEEAEKAALQAALLNYQGQFQNLKNMKMDYESSQQKIQEEKARAAAKATAALARIQAQAQAKLSQQPAELTQMQELEATQAAKAEAIRIAVEALEAARLAAKAEAARIAAADAAAQQGASQQTEAEQKAAEQKRQMEEAEKAAIAVAAKAKADEEEWKKNNPEFEDNDDAWSD